MPIEHTPGPCFAVLLISTCIALAATVGRAQTVSSDALRRCASIEGGVERLDCFDSLARSLDGDAPFAPTDPATDSVTEAGVAAFGSELIEDADVETPREIQSRLVGDFSGWRGDTIFRLENGQVWRQAEEGRFFFSAQAPLVTIRRGAFSSYRLSIDGVNSTVRVRRVE